MRIALLSSPWLFVALLACGGEEIAVTPGGGGASSIGGGGEGAGAAGGGETETCGPAEAETSALGFDGIDDHVTMGGAPALGLAELTVEAWVRRDGKGIDFSTGAGGLRLVPLAGKGRGEKDGSELDCNYAFGFFGDVLGADFEDMASGANHPIVGKTAVSWGSWHHVAASYDGTTWRLYLDGVLDGEATVNATPRHDSIQHFGIGTAFNSTGVPVGSLHGAVDELRVWDHARSDEQIADNMYRALATGPGLVARWGLDEEDGGVVDSFGQIPGTVSGASFVEPGAVLDRGAPPKVVVAAPEPGSPVDSGEVDLDLSLDDPDGDELIVTFHVRQISEAEDFTVVVMPDTQRYTIQGQGLEGYFRDQTQWIVDNADAYGILAVIHNGDIVQNGDNLVQWGVADEAMSTLEAPLGGALDGIPYGVCVGNHDQSPIGTTNDTAEFNQFFGVSRFEGRPYYGGHYGNDNDENWFTFAAGGRDFVVVNLQFDTDPSPAVLAWARSIFESHPEAFGILNSHFIVNASGGFGAQGQAIYDALRDVDNLQLMTAGHISAEAARTDTFEGNVIHSMLADYQGRADGGAGYMRIWEFSPANDELTVRTYSPTLDVWETDEDSEFTVAVDLPGVGGSFEELATIDPATTQASAVLSGLTPGQTYEWYATITDCAHTVTTPLQRLKTSP